MKKLGAKHDEKDLFAINYRFQGVAEKIPETQGTVLVKRIKLEVRSVKSALGGSGYEESNLSRGFSRKGARLKQ
jgi:hypothetical protein